MRNCNQIDLIVRDVPTAARFFRDIVGLTLRVDDPHFAELDGQTITIMLSSDALVPVQPASGIILHIQVEDVRAALEQALAHQDRVLLEPIHTDWGTESAIIAGPEGIAIDFYQPL